MVDTVFSQPDEMSGEGQIIVEKSRGLWWAFAVLLIGLGVACALGYHSLHQDRLALSMLPETVSSVTSLGTRIDDLETKVSAWPSQWSGLVDRVTKLDRRVNYDYGRARKYAESLNSQTEQRFQAMLNNQKSDVDAELNQMKSNLEDQRAQLTSLQEKFSSTQAEIAALRNDSQQNLAGLQHQVDETARQTDSLAQAEETTKISFEAEKKHSTELVSGVALHVSRTDTRHQRYGGWVSLSLDNEGRTLWLESRGIDQPVIFNSVRDGGEYDLVVTRVNRHSVVGYLVMPSKQAENTENSSLRPAAGSALDRSGE